MLSTILKPNALETSFFHNNPLPCLLLQVPTLRILNANAAAVAFFQAAQYTFEQSNFRNVIESETGTDLYGLLKKFGGDSKPLFLSCKTGTGTTRMQVFVSHLYVDEPLLGVMLVHDAARPPATPESLLAAMVHETSDVLTLADLDFKPITWSKAAEQLYGITSEQAVKTNIRRYIDFQYHEISAPDVRRQVHKAGSWRGEMSFVRPVDGRKITVLITFKLVRDKEGQPLYYVISCTDITEQKETEARLRDTEKKLQQSEAFYRTLIADSVDGKFLTTAAGTITFASPSIQIILGYAADELTGHNAFAFVHAEDRPAALAAFQNEIEHTPEVKSIEVRILKKDGTWLWCSVRGHNLLDNPHIGRMVISLHDDTQRKHAIDALRESEQRFRALIKDVRLGVTLQDAAGRLLMYNKAAVDLFQADEKELEGASLHGLLKKVVHEDGTPFSYEDWPMLQAAQTGQPVGNVVMGIYKNAAERTWLLVNANPVPDETGNIRHIISSFTDVTAHKKLAKRLLDEQVNQQRLITQATIDGQERERKEIGKELHDNIGQQLATTKLYLDLVQPKTATAAEMLARAMSAVSDTINEVRTISHSLVPPTLGDLGLVESVHGLVHTLGLVQKLEVHFQHNNFDETGIPENGKLMLYRIIQEALNNIVKHAQATVVQLHLSRDASIISLQIKDNGQGFAPEKIRKGLGLHNMRNRAELFGGHIAIQTAPGAGCTLQVTIPHLFRLRES